MVGENILDYLFKQAVSTLGSKWNINVGVEDIEVDPQLLFRCIITVSNNTIEDIEQLFQYELRAGSSIFIWLFWLYERVRLTLHYLEHVWMWSKRHSQRCVLSFWMVDHFSNGSHGYKSLHLVPYVNDTAYLSDQII